MIDGFCPYTPTPGINVTSAHKTITIVRKVNNGFVDLKHITHTATTNAAHMIAIGYKNGESSSFKMSMYEFL
ncbi:hypothetical protein JNE12001_33510 [Escherichia coli]